MKRKLWPIGPLWIFHAGYKYYCFILEFDVLFWEWKIALSYFIFFPKNNEITATLNIDKLSNHVYCFVWLFSLAHFLFLYFCISQIWKFKDIPYDKRGSESSFSLEENFHPLYQERITMLKRFKVLKTLLKLLHFYP